MAAVLMPRSPLERSKSGTLDYPDQYDRKMIQWKEAFKEEALEELRMSREFEKVRDYIDALEGDQWKRRPNLPRHLNRFVDNQLSKARKDARAQYTDIRPTMTVRSSHEGFKKTADVLTNIILHEWNRSRIDLSLAEVIDHAMFGCGFWKLGAVSGIDGVSAARLIVTPCGMDTVLPLHCGNNIQLASGVLYRLHKTIQYFRKLFGNKADGLERYSVSYNEQRSATPYERPAHLPQYQWSSLSPSMKRWMRVRRVEGPGEQSDTALYPIIPLEEYWIEDDSTNDSRETKLVRDPNLSPFEHNYWYLVKPGQKLFPRKRLLVFGGDRPLYDGPNPYFHGLYPFAMLMLDPVVWAPRGLSKYRNLMPLQDALNEIPAGVIEMIRRAIRPTIAGRKGAIADADWDRFFPDIPGAKLRMMPNADPTKDIRTLQAPEIPAYVMQFLLQYLLPAFQGHAGNLDMTQLAKKKQVPGADTVEQMRDSQGSHFRLEGRFIEAFLGESGIQAVSNCLQYFNLKSRIEILGTDGQVIEDCDWDPDTMIPAGMAKEVFWRNFSIEIVAGSLLGSSKDREQQIALVLARLGKLDTETLLRKAGFGRQETEQILARLKAEHSAMPQAPGRTPRMTRSQRTGSPI